MTGALSGEVAAFRARRGAVRGSRGKKVYGITERGERLFEELLAAESEHGDDRAFHLKLAFARYLPAEARLGPPRAAAGPAGGAPGQGPATIRAHRPRRLDGYARSLMEHSTETTERDISWLDQLIESERQEATAHD